MEGRSREGGRVEVGGRVRMGGREELWEGVRVEMREEW